MDLLARVPEETDLLACVRIISDAFAFCDCERADLVAMWSQFLHEKCAITALLEDQQRPPASRIVGFRLGVFVTDEFARQVQCVSPPYLSQQVLRLWRDDGSPVLSLEQLRAANRDGGLNWLNLHCSWGALSLSPHESGTVHDQMLGALFQALAGYQLKSAQQEVYGAQQRQTFEAFGMRVENDYHAWFARPDQKSPPAEQHPYGFGITREAARDPRHEGTYVRAMFAHTPPHFGFSPVEQELLLAALGGATDRELSAKLCRSPAAIKKQWLRIYEKVALADAEIFADDRSDEPGRGLEKKRVLLKYLRHHCEELRPR